MPRRSWSAAIRSRPPTPALPTSPPALSAGYTETITAVPGTTAVSLAASVNPAVAGQAVTLTATVTAVASNTTIPTGTVTFQDSGTVLGTATLSAGKATYTTSALALGSHAITASYAGTSSLAASTSGSLTEQVNQDVTTTTVVATGAAPTRRPVGRLPGRGADRCPGRRHRHGHRDL